MPSFFLGGGPKKKSRFAGPYKADYFSSFDCVTDIKKYLKKGIMTRKKKKPSKVIPVYSMPYNVFDPDSPVWHW